MREQKRGQSSVQYNTEYEGVKRRMIPVANKRRHATIAVPIEPAHNGAKVAYGWAGAIPAGLDFGAARSAVPLVGRVGRISASPRRRRKTAERRHCH